MNPSVTEETTVTMQSLALDPSGHEPIRAELYGLEHLEAHACLLAKSLPAAVVIPGRQLLRDFTRNSRALTQTHAWISAAYRRQEKFDADAEWLLDNFHIIADTLAEIRSELPVSYYRLLPKLPSGPWHGLPRVYALGLELISHCDSCLDETSIVHFVQAFQTIAPLTIGELWAAPIMLRLILIDNLRRLAEQIWRRRTDKQEAHQCITQFVQRAPDQGPTSWHSGLRALRPQADWSDPFVVHLLQFLRDHAGSHMGLVEGFEQFLAQRGVSAPEVLRREQQCQAANQVTIGNSVTSLRLLSALDWTSFFERTSEVEARLRDDPAGIYARQDFATRDRYRRAVEQLSRGADQSEIGVVRQVLALAGRDSTEPARNHVGYYLIDKGRRELEAAIRYCPRIGDRCLRILLAHPAVFYLGGSALLTVLLWIGIGIGAHAIDDFTNQLWSWRVLFLLLGLLAASELAIGLVNSLAAWLVPPRVLPKLNLKEGIPADCATFVVVPSMLVRAESSAQLVGRLEIHYLANPDPNLYFALLTDFTDAPNENQPEDEKHLRDALDGIKALNQRYGKGGADRFFLFHRQRQWNAMQQCWMGWERKRGKLVEFNRLLRGDRATSFTVCSGDPDRVPRIRFVITLDADTQLPLETARRLIATLAHTLNRPVIDTLRGRVTAGYGVLQPRVGITLTSARKSLFSHVFAGSAGIDPYTTAVSDVYQDLFGIGSFTGKGIYDVDAFQAAVGSTFPDNHILSHDLIEGNYARCGLVTDIELIDEFPTQYAAFARREHRWVRGDWQIVPWLFRTVPTGDGRKRTNPLPAVERWKIFDNLRRSMVPPALVAILLLSWLVLPEVLMTATVVVVAVLFWPLFLQLLNIAFAGVHGLFHGKRVRWLQPHLILTVSQAMLNGCFLAEQARLMFDASVKTLLRLYVSKRHLLEWETAAAAERRLGNSFRAIWQNMWPIATFSAVVLLAVVLREPMALPAALPFLLAWMLSPAVAYRISCPRPAQVLEPTADEQRYLRRLARLTWQFFETFVGDEDHHLPPDNYQEEPKEAVAHRTSPTNIGLYLLSCLASHDLGYLTLRALLDRLEKTFATLDRLERWHGHLYNWYDTLTLKLLTPAYISTVDSGNFLACLVTLQHGLREKAVAPISVDAIRDGLADNLALVAEALQALETPKDALAAVQQLESHIHALSGMLAKLPAAPKTCGTWLEEINVLTDKLHNDVQSFATLLHETPDDLFHSISSLATLARERYAEAFERPPVRHCPTEGNGTGAPSGRDTLRDRLRQLDARIDALARAMDFKVLYNGDRHLFAVGYNLTLGRLDNAHYDLLASEAALTSFLAIARGDVPRQHWFQLGRPLARSGHALALVSWGGTMFEYLLPRLFLPRFPETLLDESQRAAVAFQVAYGHHCRVPWGISESAFSAVDADLNYQYQAFGVPGSGLKRGLARDLVVAPYATMLALTVDPRRALHNLKRLANEDAEGTYGFYEAIDYTRERLPDQRRSLLVKCYMAHHQGMSLLALAECLNRDAMLRRFRAEAMVRATELLLQERLPEDVLPMQFHGEESALPATTGGNSLTSRRLTTPHTAHPRTHLLSNGQYTVMLTNAGAGFSICRGLDVTRRREDCTCDSWGSYFYVRDGDSGRVWSAGHQPTCHDADEYEVIFSTDKAEIRRVDGPIETHMEVTVSPEHQAEIRRVLLTNHDSRPHDLELTSYVELVLGPHGADAAHPAFGKLFLETEFVPEEEALLCHRRPRTRDEKAVWSIHVIAIEGAAEPAFLGPVQHETDRARFLGRGRTLAQPAAFDRGARLSGSTGPVLDPIFSLRRAVRVAPNTSVAIAFTTAIAESREEALALADHYHNFHGATRAFELAYAHSHVQLRHLHLSAEEVHLFQRLAAHVLYAGSALRAAPAVLAANRQGQAGLWRYGISGDHPIVLVRIAEPEELALVRQLLAAHMYWRLKGLTADLVILNEHQSGYFADLQHQLHHMVRDSDERDVIDKPGGVFVRQAQQLPEDDKVLIQAVARCILMGNGGSLAGQIERCDRRMISRNKSISRQTKSAAPVPPRAAPRRSDLLFANGLGGFTADGREYVISIVPSKEASGSAAAAMILPPAPWSNVIANPSFGFLVTESGCGCTWAGNSQSNRLTPWCNDPVTDAPGEVIFLRDEETGRFWTPTPLPIGSGNYEVRHGQGYSIFANDNQGLATQLTLFVPPGDPVKLFCLKIRNPGRRARRLSAWFYIEWVLGSVREQSAPHVVTEIDMPSGALLARNRYHADSAACVAFADCSLQPRSYTADRTEFIGRNGSLAAPEALSVTDLSATVGAALDPCAALRAPFHLQAGEEIDVVFLLGQADSVEEVRRLVQDYKPPEQARTAFTAMTQAWDRLLGAVQVRTPDPALDVLVNRWLPYQVLSCRLWGRSAFYQSSGAYGFRDQLQDVLALLHAAPQEARAHILRAAGRQFLEGDVQHWWHPPAGGGVRTRISDDYLWLPFVVGHYVAATGDRAILDETVPFLDAPVLQPQQDEDYRVPQISNEKASLYDHCLRAIEHGRRFGVHGLPLMGTGDWNDGMNRVGAGGRGESVWNGWFLLMILRDFADLVASRGDSQRAAEYRAEAERLHQAQEENAWDGQWYRRAYFDDGTPLGSKDNDECRIDSLTQTWTVISRGGEVQRSEEAMAALEQHLIQDQDRLILLLEPAFDNGKLDPGYIKGYLPGIRENGGQYTHAAVWVVLATALLGKGTRAKALFDLLNPIRHSATADDVSRYRVEPYVAAADVYSSPPHTGRGGWTWYTGSAGWLYRVVVDHMLGLKRQEGHLALQPCIPHDWPNYEITVRHAAATYRIQVENPHKLEVGVPHVTVDGQEHAGAIELQGTGDHVVVVVLGEK